MDQYWKRKFSDLFKERSKELQAARTSMSSPSLKITDPSSPFVVSEQTPEEYQGYGMSPQNIQENNQNFNTLS